MKPDHHMTADHVVVLKHMIVHIKEAHSLDDRQITHLICVRLKHLLYDFSRGCYGPLYKKQQEGGPKHPQKSHIANVLDGHRLDE